MLTVDHRFALSNPALVSAPSKKSFSSVSSPILACNDFTSMAGPGRCRGTCPENVRGTALQLGLPRRDLIGVDIKVLGQLRQRSIALDGGQRYFRLEGRGMGSAGSSAHRRSCLRQLSPHSGRNSTYRDVQISETSCVCFTVDREEAVSLLVAIIREQRLEEALEGLRLAGLLNEPAKDRHAGVGSEADLRGAAEGECPGALTDSPADGMSKSGWGRQKLSAPACELKAASKFAA
ncbi:hypothetical protein ACVWZZ_005570 [Bradyrhizobium sp. LM6.10]